MTTIILAQKLSTMKLDLTELESIRWHQVYIGQKKHKAINSLKVIIEQQDVNKTCRLCLKRGERKIFGDNTDFNIALNIRQILGIEITENDGKPQHLCKSCEHTVRQASQLKQTAEITEWRLQQEQEMVAELADSPRECSDNESDSHGGYFKVLDTDVAREWTCSKCQRTFHSQEEFNDHEKLPSCRAKVSGYVCESCGCELKTMSRLKRHRLTHTDSLHHACAHCPYRARTKYALSVHERCHSGQRPLRCRECGAAFRSASALASHRRRHMPPRYHCTRCQRGFTFRAALQNHMATQHSNVKPYNCSICGKAFSTRKMILRHELKAHNRPKMRSGVLPSYMRQEQNT